MESDKLSKYQDIVPKIKAIIDEEAGLTANLANICAAITEAFGFLWVGFYLVEGNELIVGPFQGPVACTRIAFGKGVCGTAWEVDKVVIVDNVYRFPGHIACSTEANSEIVIPIHAKNSEVKMVLDIDSSELSAFDDIDAKYLGEIAQVIERLL